MSKFKEPGTHYFIYQEPGTGITRQVYNEIATVMAPKTKGGTVIVIDPLVPRPDPGTDPFPSWTFVQSYGIDEVLVTFSPIDKKVCVSDSAKADMHCMPQGTYLLYAIEERCDVYFKIDT